MLVSFFQMVLSDELQSLLQIMLQLAKVITNMMDTILPAVDQLQNFMINVQDLNLLANNEFKQVRTLYFRTVFNLDATPGQKEWRLLF